MLQRQTHVPPPSLLLALTEAHRAVLDTILLSITRRTLDKMAPRGDGHAVMVLPGFLAGDGRNAPLRCFLGSLNYAVHGWGQGRNLGPRNGVQKRLEKRLDELMNRYEGPVSLVGHSLGGIFAREMARVYPEKVRQVISLGSPFGEGRMTASHPARLFSALNPYDELSMDESVLAQAPPVPTTAIYSRGDGVVNWQTTLQHAGHARIQSIRVRGSHCGMTLNPAIWLLLAECLATRPEDWKPFERSSWRALVYPKPD